MEMKKHYKTLESLIKCYESEIVDMVDWIKDIKTKVDIKEKTIEKIKAYISDVKSEIDTLNIQKKEFEDVIESARLRSDITPAEYSAVKYRYIYGWTIPQICDFLGKNPKTVNRYLRNAESKLEMVI